MVEKVNLNQLREKFEEVVAETTSFEEASNWASGLIEKINSGVVSYELEKDRAKIMDGLTFLSGLDIIDFDGDYFHSIKNVKDLSRKLF